MTVIANLFQRSVQPEQGSIVGNRFPSGVISFDFQAGTILFKFNDTEQDMDKLEPHTSKEGAWRSRLLRHGDRLPGGLWAYCNRRR